MPHNDNLVPTDWRAVTPSDTVSINVAGIYVGTGGDVAVETGKGTTTTFPAVPSGTVLPGIFRRVLATGTTASGIVGAHP